MGVGSVLLNQTAQGVATASGDVEISFPVPKMTRVWQGTVSVTNAPAGTSFTVSVGGQPAGVLYSPGPFGPIQVQSGLSLQLAATGLVSGTSYQAILLGVDDPIENPTPYTGPTAVTSITLGGP